MKGIIFTEFFERVENSFSIDVAEQMLEEASLGSGGIYTSVGNYDHRELLLLVEQLSLITGLPEQELMMSFGKYLFVRFTELYPGMLTGRTSVFSFIESVEEVIHVNVRKLYPDAELPTIVTARLDDGSLQVAYRSPRKLGDIAHAMLSGCIQYFDEAFAIDRTDQQDDEGPFVQFRIYPVDVRVEACSK